jgi:hypothetical protein
LLQILVRSYQKSIINQRQPIMKNHYKPLILMLALALYSASIFSQEDTPPQYRIVTTDGNIFVGHIIEESDTEIVIKTEQLGDLRIARTNIRSMSVIRPETLVEGVYWPDNPQSARYFWAPNGYGMKAGEIYYQNIWVLYNQVSFGVTDHFSVSAGLVPLFLMGGGATPVWVVPKFSVPIESDKVQLGAGAFLGALLGEGEVFGIAFASATFGSRDLNTNFGLGWGFTGNGWARHPIVNLGFMARTGPRGYFLSENYLFPGETTIVLISGGGRRIIGDGVGLDFGLFIPLNAGFGFLGLPFLGVTIPIGSK